MAPEALAERIQSSVSHPINLPGGGEYRLRISVGVAVYPDNGVDATALLTAADAARREWLSALFDGGQFAQLYLVGGKMTAETVQAADFQMAMWAFLAVYLPLSLLFWHAPALVHWHGVPPVKSLFFSIVACWRNMGAFTLYGLAWMGVFAGGGILMSVLSAVLIVTLGEAAAAIAAGVMVLAVMVMASMMFTSTYFTFRDCFTPTETSTAEA